MNYVDKIWMVAACCLMFIAGYGSKHYEEQALLDQYESCIEDKNRELKSMEDLIMRRSFEHEH